MEIRAVDNFLPDKNFDEVLMYCKNASYSYGEVDLRLHSSMIFYLTVTIPKLVQRLALESRMPYNKQVIKQPHLNEIRSHFCCR
jgi:hypothetical protein